VYFLRHGDIVVRRRNRNDFGYTTLYTNYAGNATKRSINLTPRSIGNELVYLFRMFKIQSIDQKRRSQQKPLFVRVGTLRKVNLVIVDFVESLFERCLWYFRHSSNWFRVFFAGCIIDITGDHTTAKGARILSFREAIHAHTVGTGRGSNDVDFFFVLVDDSELWNTVPARFLDVSQVIIPTKNGGLLSETALELTHAAPERPIDLDEFRLGFRVLERHIEGMARGAAAATHERKIFLGPRHHFVAVHISKVGFCGATEKFLQPPPSILPNFHGVAGAERTPQGVRPDVPVHGLVRRRRHFDGFLSIIPSAVVCVLYLSQLFLETIVVDQQLLFPFDVQCYFEITS